MKVLSLIQDGGPVMYILVICSIVLWAVVLEKLWFLHNFCKNIQLLYEQAGRLLSERKLHEARGLGHNLHPLIVAAYLAIFEDGKKDKERYEARITRRLSETQMGLKRFMWILGTIGASAPFIGLFGTVVGIIKSFESIAGSGKSGFSVVAAGLSEALIATAAGIFVAVIAVIFYNYFQNRLQTVIFELKIRLEDLMDKLVIGE